MLLSLKQWLCSLIMLDFAMGLMKTSEKSYVCHMGKATSFKTIKMIDIKEFNTAHSICVLKSAFPNLAPLSWPVWLGIVETEGFLENDFYIFYILFKNKRTREKEHWKTRFRMPKDDENKIFILLITLHFMNDDTDSWGVRE